MSRRIKTIDEIPAGCFPCTHEGLHDLQEKIHVTMEHNTNDTQGDGGDREYDVFIGPVPVLQETEDYPIYGVFANKDIHLENGSMPLFLGEYQGDYIEAQESEDIYAIDAGSGYVVSAKERGSWARMVNTTDSEDTANVSYVSRGQKVYFYLIRELKAGEQLLVYYGEDHELEIKRFLHKSDNWQTSEERYKSHRDLYRMEVKDGITYAVPIIDALDARTIDLPILKQASDGTFLPQHQQENKNLVIWACEQGDFGLLQYALSLSPDTNMQTRIGGCTALHAVMRNPLLDASEKIRFLDALLTNKNTLLHLQDKDEDSILHIAIAQEEVELIAYILKAREGRASKTNTDIHDCVNDKGHDFIFAALNTGSVDVINALRPFMQSYDLEHVIDDDHADLLAEIWQELKSSSDFERLCEIKASFKSLFAKESEHDLATLDTCLDISMPGEKKSAALDKVHAYLKALKEAGKLKKMALQKPKPKVASKPTVSLKRKAEVESQAEGKRERLTTAKAYTFFRKSLKYLPADTKSRWRQPPLYKYPEGFLPVIYGNYTDETSHHERIHPDASVDDIQSRLEELQYSPECTLYLTPNLSDELLLTVAKHLPHSRKIRLDPELSLDQMRLIASNLRDRADLMLSADLSLTQMNYVAEHVNANATLTFWEVRYHPVHEVKEVIGHLNPEANFKINCCMPLKYLEGISVSLPENTGVIIQDSYEEPLELLYSDEEISAILHALQNNRVFLPNSPDLNDYDRVLSCLPDGNHIIFDVGVGEHVQDYVMSRYGHQSSSNINGV